MKLGKSNCDRCGCTWHSITSQFICLYPQGSYLNQQHLPTTIVGSHMLANVLCLCDHIPACIWSLKNESILHQFMLSMISPLEYPILFTVVLLSTCLSSRVSLAKHQVGGHLGFAMTQVTLPNNTINLTTTMPIHPNPKPTLPLNTHCAPCAFVFHIDFWQVTYLTLTPRSPDLFTFRLQSCRCWCLNLLNTKDVRQLIN